jgi:N-sulfoglucosamine sulfohydrolase
MSTSRPNILYIHSHDTGRYVQPYGYGIATPRIQQLAEEGVLFRQAFCAAPTCSPSRASLLTGQYAHSTGMLGLAHRGFSLRDGKQHIVHTLRKAGYYSALIGEEHISEDPYTLGYNYVAPLKDTHAESVAPTVVSVLRDRPQQPFFLAVGFAETHREYAEPLSPEIANYTLPPSPIPDTPETRRDMAAFKASAAALDHGIGEVLDALESCGLADNTLVICTTDHGLAFPNMKGNLTDSGIGVMLILRGPGGFRGGKVCDVIVSQIDLFPTICDLAGIEHPSWLQGESLLPLVHGEVEQVHDAIFAETTYHAAYEPIRAIRTQRWKYIRRFDTHNGPVLPNTDDSLSKTFWLNYGWQKRPRPLEQLYDLIFDPTEGGNLVNDPTFAPILEDMRSRLKDWMQKTNDPLLHGSVAATPGAELNDQEQLSAMQPTRFA